MLTFHTNRILSGSSKMKIVSTRASILLLLSSTTARAFYVSPMTTAIPKTTDPLIMNPPPRSNRCVRCFGVSSETMKKIFLSDYSPDPTHTSYLSRVQEKKEGDVSVKVAVLGSQESSRFFGVPLSSRGIQPIWLEVDNSQGDSHLFLDRVRLDPNYYPPLEAAGTCHYGSVKRILAQGFVYWIIFLPLVFLLPLKVLTAPYANRKMDEYFSKHSFPLGQVEKGSIKKGFVFGTLDDGTKIVHVDLLSPKGFRQLVFSVPVPGMTVDYEGREPQLENAETVECSAAILKTRLELEPRAVTNSRATKEGDPVNLVVVADFSTLLTAFGPRWDETEPISLDTCIKTAKSFVFGSEYRYSPVSSLYMYGRSQDFALQRARGSINLRLHLRLWLSPMRFEGKPVWVGQISRDIGVRLAKTWNLTTHRIDPNVDEARDYVITDLLQSGHLEKVGWVGGVGVSKKEKPRENLTGDPFVTDGKRAVVILSPTKTAEPKVLEW